MLHMVYSCYIKKRIILTEQVAIILECIHVLNTIDTLLLENLVGAEEVSPFSVLDRFLSSGNHTMRYLGLSGLEQTDLNLCSDDWRDCQRLSKILETSQADKTIIYKVCYLYQ